MPARPDCYTSFAHLQQHEVLGQDYAVRSRLSRSRLVICAPHGGGIEPGTGELAWALAGDQYSVYCFEGMKPGDNDCLHLTSTRFDDPGCLEILAASHSVLTLHGCQGSRDQIHIGGLARVWGEQIRTTLQAGGFSACWDGSGNPGTHPRNLCNRGALGQGVQLEIEESLRRRLFRGLDRTGRQHPTPLLAELVAALRPALAWAEQAEGL